MFRFATREIKCNYLSSRLQRLYRHHHVQILIFVLLIVSSLLNLPQPLLKLPLQAEFAESVVLLRRALHLGLELLDLLLQELHRLKPVLLLQLLLRLPPPGVGQLLGASGLRSTGSLPLLSGRFLEGNMFCWWDAHLRFYSLTPEYAGPVLL